MFGLRMKLLAGLAGLMAILITVTVLANTVLWHYSDSIQHLFREDYESAAASQSMKESLERMLERAQVRAWESEPAPPFVSPDPDVVAFEQKLKLQEQIADVPGEKEATARLAEDWARFRTGYLSIFHPSQTYAERRRLFLSEILPQAAEIRQAAQTVIDMNLTYMESGRGAAVLSAARARQTMHLLAAAGIGLAVCIVLFAGVIVLRPIRLLEQAARQISRGNLDLSLPVNSRDEIGQLGRAFNDMAAQLRVFKRIDHEKLMRTQRTTQLAIDSLPDAVVVIDPRGHIELTNDTAKRLFQLQPGLNVIEMTTPWLSDLHQQAIAHARPSRQAGYTAAIRVDDGGEEKSFLPRTFPILDEAANLIGSAIVLADVTELRRLDEMKTSLLSTTAHELKTPLTSMRMIMHLVAEQRIGALNARQAELIAAAREDSDRLHHVVETLLDMDRIRSGRALMETRPIEVERLVSDCTAPLRGAIEAKGIGLSVAVPGGGGVVRVDEERMMHVFANLVGNAIKYTPAGGKIVISAAEQGGGVHFTVADTGKGIAEQFKGRVFEKFFRAPGQSGESGTGLGLAIVKEIVEAHGGRVWLDSREGSGTSVHFILTMEVEPQQEIQHESANPVAAA